MILYPMTLISMRLKSLWYKLLLFGKNQFYSSQEFSWLVLCIVWTRV
jgi:hypothetical protein